MGHTGEDSPFFRPIGNGSLGDWMSIGLMGGVCGSVLDQSFDRGVVYVHPLSASRLYIMAQ